MSSKLTNEEIRQAAATLRRLDPGLLPFSIFLEVARLTVMPIIDVVPVRRNGNGHVEVLLTARELDDLYWPGMWHNPGTVIRATDVDPQYGDAFKRIFQDELGIVGLPECHFVRAFLHKTSRGVESTRVYWTELNEIPEVGTFFEVNKLPKNTIESHIELIKMAAKAYEEQT